MLDCIVIQFAKFPRLGGVKTRMQPFLSPEQSLELHVRLLSHVNRMLCESEVFQILALDQLAEHPVLNTLAEQTPIILQRGDDLGERMKNALNWGLTKAQKVIIVGSDCAALTASHIQQVAVQLDTHSHVFIPAEDGGYVLIAATECNQEVFQNVDWGTHKVMAQTRDILDKANIRFSQLPALWDVDRPEDYQRLLSEIVFE